MSTLNIQMVRAMDVFNRHQEELEEIRKNSIDYKFNEKNLLEEMQEYIDATYTQHYAKNKFQATEFIFDSGHAQGFCIGNILKYAQRYGKKGTVTESRRDLQKVIHYAIMALHAHDTDQ